MLRIYNKTKTKIHPFTKYINLSITKNLEMDDRSLSFEAPYLEIRDIVELEGYIETDTDIFVIKEIEKTSVDGKMAKVYAQLNLEDLEGRAWPNFRTTNQTITQVLTLALSGTGWELNTCDVTKRRTIEVMGSSLDVIKQCLSTYQVEIIFYSRSKRISIVEKRGTNKGVYFISSLNLKQLDVKSNSHEFYTEIEPYGKDFLDISSVNGGQKYLSNYTYSNKKKRFIWKDERYEDKTHLKEDALKKLEDLCKPYTSYSAYVRDLAAFSDEYDFLDYDLGDTVRLLDSSTDTAEDQRITEMTIYPDSPENNTVTIANTKLTFDEYIQKYNDAAQTVTNVTGGSNNTISSSSIRSVDASKVENLDEAVAETGSFQDLTAEVVTVTGRLTAAEADIGTLRANVGEFESLTADHFNAVDANIVYLQTNALTAGSAVITGLEANYANIKTVLSGNIGTGDLQTVVLNTRNASIDTALVKQLVSQNITVNDLLAGRISTNKFEIGSDDGGLLFQGNLAQWTDENDQVRIQIGKDGSGNYSFVIADQNGTPLFYENGITAEGIPNNVIVNDMVAGNANIAASKLDINSLFSVINEDNTHTLYSTKISMSESGQSLDAAFTRMTQDVDRSISAAQDATDAAERALEAISGIDTLDALGISLSNDAHVVHTETDGTGGVWTDCNSTITVFLGDTNITAQAEISVETSSNITGTYNPSTYTYQVTGMTGDDGWVDFYALYGTQKSPMTDRSGAYLTTRDGKVLGGRGGGLSIKKRFSVSKARDGKIGHSYRIESDVPVIKKQLDGQTLIPSSVVFSALYNFGSGDIPYLGRFKIEESMDDVRYTQTYFSAAPENTVTYTPSSYDVKFIRATLYDGTGDFKYDYMSVILLVDTEAMKTEVSTIRTELTEYKFAQDEMKVEFATLESDYFGTKEGNLILQTPYRISGDDVSFRAIIYKAGKDVTNDYPESAFQWITRTEDGDNNLGTGYTKVASKSAMGFGGVMICRFYYE